MEEKELLGLTDEQVQAQMQAGKKNTKQPLLTRSVKDIIWQNTFTLFNFINVFLGALVFFTGSYKNMLFLLIATLNTSIGIIQEIRSKRQVDKMALLSQSKVKVRRNGKTVQISPDDLVEEDLLLLDLGDQIPVDGVVAQTAELEIDESQITGESDVILKSTGDALISGSFVVSGHAVMRVTKVGKETFVNSITEKIKKSDRTNSELLNLINKIIKILTFIIIPLGIGLFISRIMHNVDLTESILGTVAAMIGMIPEGLILLSSVTLAISAYHLAKKQVLVKDLASIETLARVDTVCLDKTGTITSGKLTFKELTNVAPGYRKAEVAEIIGSLVHAINDTNETAQALQTAFPGDGNAARRIVPFSSARKWSGVELANQGNYILGAPQFVLQLTADQKQTIHQYASQGNRVLALVKARKMEVTGCEQTELIALILITDVIRPDAADTLLYLKNQGVTSKVISGDDPVTVASIAGRAQIDNPNRLIDMSEVDDDADYQKIAAANTIFGRVKPEQKERLMKALQANGHTVAMIGDGVNDILALRQANCGIAMASGNESTKSIADFVLINSNFSALINVLKEGRRVINNIDSIAALYLIKTMFSVLLSIIFIFVAKSYPFQPIQLTPINSLMVGVPSFLLALAPDFRPVQNRFFSGVIGISLPSALCVVFYIWMIGVIAPFIGLSQPQADTLNVLLTGLVCWNALLLLGRPLNRYKGMIVTGSILAFSVVFLLFGKFFSLTTMFELPIFLTGAGLLITIPVMFNFVQKMVLAGKRLVKQ
ncbi:HAD-IC family P-type ATPase [Fructilactobacillus vespulae]|uniref:HAD-IC family P-type ATPase n=1 Tax=Fructilactobacillus vespulae TaxID=1249630 RepID=UPI0039B364B7